MRSDPRPDLPGLYEKYGFSDKVRRSLELLANVLRAQEQLGAHAIHPPRVLMFGNAAVDKMEIATAVSSASGKPLVAAHASELKSTVKGESTGRIRSLFARAYAQAPCLLFIDNIDSIAAKRGIRSNDEHSDEIVSELLAHIVSAPERNILLAASAARPDDLDSAIHLRFSTRIDFWTPWHALVIRPSVKEQLLGVLRSIQSGTAGFNVLIWGPPGTGKTGMLRDLADGSRLALVGAGGRDFRAGYIGQSANLVRKVFEKARSMAPSILLLDLEQGPYSDDCVLPPRSSRESDFVADEIVCEVLVQMDFLRRKHPPVFILAETFHIDRVEPAVVSRCDVRIEIPLPDELERSQIFEQMIRTSARSDPGFDVDETSAHLARSLPGASGRDLDYVVRTAIDRASDRDHRQVTREDLIAAAKESRMYVAD